MHDEINTYFDDLLLKIQRGFRKRYSAHYCLFYMMEKIRKRRDSKRVFFGCSHELLLAKLRAYGFYICLLESIETEKESRFQFKNFNRQTHDILFGVPPGSILGPLLFKIYIYNLFILNDHLEFGSYADHTIPLVRGENFNQNTR